MPSLFPLAKLSKMPSRTNTLAFDLVEMGPKYGKGTKIIKTKMEMAQFLNVLIHF
jgi:hypothetical protein